MTELVSKIIWNIRRLINSFAYKYIHSIKKCYLLRKRRHFVKVSGLTIQTVTGLFLHLLCQCLVPNATYLGCSPLNLLNIKCLQQSRIYSEYLETIPQEKWLKCLKLLDWRYRCWRFPSLSIIIRKKVWVYPLFIPRSEWESMRKGAGKWM